jgi:uncharacterized protein YndB with AHSA1/START domain
MGGDRERRMSSPGRGAPGYQPGDDLDRGLRGNVAWLRNEHGREEPSAAKSETEMTASEDAPAVRIEHRVAAPPHAVYRAWLDPDLVRRWMAPGDQEVTRVEIDERVGGPWRTWRAESGTVVGGFDSELLDLVPDQRIAFRWGLIGPERRHGPSFDTRLTITLRAEPPGTALTLVHEDLGELAAAMLHIAENVGPGWEATLNKLDELLAEQAG